MPQGRLYLDHAATTPILPEATAAMIDAFSKWHNPSSPHAEGRAAKAALQDARERIAAALGWTGKIIFTSGASEALAIALQRAKAGPRYISAVEHDAVQRAAPQATILPVGPDGAANLATVSGDRPLVAIQHANNETGIIQPLERHAQLVRGLNGILLVDCAQTAGKIALPEADLIAISAHKFGGSPGVGALLVRDLALIEAIGGQEQGYRSGTENLPGIVGMAAALEADRSWTERAVALRRRLEDFIVEAGGEVVGAGSDRVATIGAYRMPGVPSNTQLIRFDLSGVAVSAGSACSSGSLKQSRILAALGWQETCAQEVIRVSFGRSTSEEDIDRFAALWSQMASGRSAA